METKNNVPRKEHDLFPETLPSIELEVEYAKATLSLSDLANMRALEDIHELLERLLILDGLSLLHRLRVLDLDLLEVVGQFEDDELELAGLEVRELRVAFLFGLDS